MPSTARLQAFHTDGSPRVRRRGRAALVGLMLIAVAAAAWWLSRRDDAAPVPHDARARFEVERARGFAAQQAGRATEAVAAYERALALVDDLDTHANLANALKATGRVDEAQREYDLVLAARPNDADTWYNLGNLRHRQRHDAQGAIEAYRRATEANPELGEAHFALGAVLLELGDTETAIVSLQAALQVSPTAAWRQDAENALALARIRDAERRGTLPPPVR